MSHRVAEYKRRRSGPNPTDFSLISEWHGIGASSPLPCAPAKVP
jgi:hypothetical protein